MIIAKGLWLLLTALLWLLTLLTANAVLLALACGMVALPLVLLPLHLAAARRVRLLVRLPVNVRKGQQATAYITAENPTLIPLCRLRCAVELHNQLNGEIRRCHVSCGVPPRGTQTMELAFSGAYCGRIALEVGQVRLYDCFGLLGVPASAGAHGACVVQPELFPQNLMMLPAAARTEEAEDYSAERPGYDLSETFQIREYVPGDSPRQIHWKLSQKLDKLIVRDPSLPITRTAAVFWERTEEHPTARRTDAQAEVLVSLCHNLLRQSVQFTVCWNEAESGQCVFQTIRELDDLIGLLPRLFTARAAEGESGAALLLQSVQAGSFSHLICVTDRIYPQTEELSALGRLTILTCGGEKPECGVCFDEEDYVRQLSELTI